LSRAPALLPFAPPAGAKGEGDENHDDKEKANSNEDKNPGRHWFQHLEIENLFAIFVLHTHAVPDRVVVFFHSGNNHGQAYSGGRVESDTKDDMSSLK